MVRAIRGATTVENNTLIEIIDETKKLLNEIIERNDINKDDVVSMIFTATQDLDAAFPALAARQVGWNDVALICMSEINVKGSLEKCIRLLIHFNTEKSNSDIKHVYLNKAKVLRPDLDEKEN